MYDKCPICKNRSHTLPGFQDAKAESPYSWTIDFVARRNQAREEMQPHTDEAKRIKAGVVSIKEKLKALRKTDAKANAIEKLETKIK